MYVFVKGAIGLRVDLGAGADDSNYLLFVVSFLGRS